MSKIDLIDFKFLIFLLTCLTASNSTKTRRFANYPKGSAVGVRLKTHEQFCVDGMDNYVAFSIVSPVYIIALAIPIKDISESVYQAFNFEANYLIPDYESGVSFYIPEGSVRTEYTAYDRIEITDVYSSIKKTFTRKNIYASIESQLYSIGFNGTACILKTICQANEIPIYETNGLLGSLFHIIFAPSSSEDENLPHHVYAAERNGLANQCNIYDADCPKSILDFMEHT